MNAQENLRTMNLSLKDLANELVDNADKCGFTDWYIGCDENGNLDCRHNTYDNTGWCIILDLYSFESPDYIDEDSEMELLEWYLNGGIDGHCRMRIEEKLIDYFGTGTLVDWIE